MFGKVMHVIDADHYIKDYDDESNNISSLVDEVSRLITIKHNNPRRAPSFIIIGAPGSGRSTQSKIIAKHYGLVHISTLNLLKNEIRLQTERGKRVKECFKTHKMVPDEIICSLVEARIRKIDCRRFGWILDGFPKTIQQITVLKAMKIKPTKIIILECDKEVCIDRILSRKIDPVTGKTYDINAEMPEEKEIQDRLAYHSEDQDRETIGKRWEVWNDFQNKVEESYHGNVLKFDTGYFSIEQVSTQICEVVQNPII